MPADLRETWRVAQLCIDFPLLGEWDCSNPIGEYRVFQHKNRVFFKSEGSPSVRGQLIPVPNNLRQGHARWEARTSEGTLHAFRFESGRLYVKPGHRDEQMWLIRDRPRFQQSLESVVAAWKSILSEEVALWVPGTHSYSSLTHLFFVIDEFNRRHKSSFRVVNPAVASIVPDIIGCLTPLLAAKPLPLKLLTMATEWLQGLRGGIEALGKSILPDSLRPGNLPVVDEVHAINNFVTDYKTAIAAQANLSFGLITSEAFLHSELDIPREDSKGLQPEALDAGMGKANEDEAGRTRHVDADERTSVGSLAETSRTSSSDGSFLKSDLFDVVEPISLPKSLHEWLQNLDASGGHTNVFTGCWPALQTKSYDILTIVSQGSEAALLEALGEDELARLKPFRVKILKRELAKLKASWQASPRPATVLEWLLSIGMAEYAEAFEKHGLTPLETMILMEEDDLAAVVELQGTAIPEGRARAFWQHLSLLRTDLQLEKEEQGRF